MVEYGSRVEHSAKSVKWLAGGVKVTVYPATADSSRLSSACSGVLDLRFIGISRNVASGCAVRQNAAAAAIFRRLFYEWVQHAPAQVPVIGLSLINIKSAPKRG